MGEKYSKAARESMVLLKNESSLPFRKTDIKSIAIIGPDAYPAALVGGGSARHARNSSGKGRRVGADADHRLRMISQIGPPPVTFLKPNVTGSGGTHAVSVKR
jgi:beta-glucosidase-like glycosyl hydrolase